VGNPGVARRRLAAGNDPAILRRGACGGVGGMRVAVTGATGNLGTSVLAALREQGDIEEIVGIARRSASSPARQGTLGQRRRRI
jgi:hypothetical protein